MTVSVAKHRQVVRFHQRIMIHESRRAESGQWDGIKAVRIADWHGKRSAILPTTANARRRKDATSIAPSPSDDLEVFRCVSQ